ncbi:MAG TPA: hypothetical protein VJU15_04065 [Gemmatimonadales bacterium]|nr:hypothetical protein [Gemmatimonadales bacterium]
MRARTLLAVAIGSLAIMGCTRDDPRLKNLTAGISKDSALAALDVRNAERPSTYLIKGKLIETMMVRREGVEGPLDSLPRTDYNPVVMIDGKLAGWGWKFWDSVSQDLGVVEKHPKPPKKRD